MPNLRKIGVLGGSFDPVHNRHLEIAQCALNEFKLEKIIFIPSGYPPHKTVYASIWDRIQMLNLATADNKLFTVSDIEAQRSGYIYTADTMEILVAQNPDCEFYYIIGEDSLNYLDEWHDPQRLFKLCKFIVCKRFNTTSDRRWEMSKLGAKLYFLTMNADNISSTEIRDTLKIRQYSNLIPISVFEYIYENGLYGVVQNNTKLKDYIIKLSTMLTNKRLAHSLAVANTARYLAYIHKVYPELATVAGLLHDCAKCMSLSTLQKIAKDNNLYLDFDIYNSALLHAPVGSLLAKTVFGIEDENIFSAINYHTTGISGMNALDMIIFLADKIEPTRASYPGLEELRKLCEIDLKKAMVLSITSTSSYLKKSGNKMHINTVRVLEWLKKL